MRLGIFCVSTISLISLTGCANYFASQKPLTPKEKEEQEVRMEQFLDDSSPRGLNKHPKANDILIEKFPVRKPKSSE